jgi:hypothetical protein
VWSWLGNPLILNSLLPAVGAEGSWRNVTLRLEREFLKINVLPKKKGLTVLPSALFGGVG